MSYRFDTLQVHGGHRPDTATHARAVPIYQSTSFCFEDSDHAARLFALREEGNIYTRIGNPTTAVLEERVNLLEGGSGTVSTASGTAAILYAILNLAGTGDEIISSRALYGGTVHLFGRIFKELGITVHLVDIRDELSVREHLGPKTRAIFTEAIGNPLNTVADLPMLAGIAHGHGIPLIVDNTAATPWLIRPFEYGADIVVHSLTKFMGGHGVSIGGAVVDGGRFSWENFPRFREPDPDLADLSFQDRFGDAAYIARLRTILLRDTGACLSPFNAFTFLLGLETLSLRMERHCENALNIAEYLDNHPRVAWVSYPGLIGHPDHALAESLLDRGFGAIIAFGPAGGYEAARRTVDRARLFSHLANIGDAKSLIIHPASTTHSQLTEHQLQEAGIGPDLIRLSVGIEDVDDLLADLEEALKEI